MVKKQKEEHGLPSLALVFGYIAIKELGRLQDRIDVLSRLGYGNQEIAMICGKSPALIRAMKSLAKKQKGRNHA